MCGIAGIIYRDGTRASDRARDDPDAAVDEAPRPGLDGLRALRARRTATSSCATSSPTRTTPRDFEFHDRLERHRTEVEVRLGNLGAQVIEIEPETEYAFRVVLDLRRRPEDARRLRRGRARTPRCSRSATRSRSSRTSATPRRWPSQYDLDGVHRHPRDRPRPHGDRVRRRHLGRAPVLGVPVLRRRGRAQRPADELLPVEAPARALRPPLPVRVRLRDHRRLPRREDDRGPRRSRTRCARASTSSTASSRTSA